MGCEVVEAIEWNDVCVCEARTHVWETFNPNDVLKIENHPKTNKQYTELY